MTLKWLLHSYQRSLLETLFKNPLRSFFLSELAKASGVDPGNTKRYLVKFAERKIIQINKHGSKTKVQADLANPETRKIFEMFELAQTALFMESLGADRFVMETFTRKVLETLPDTRLIAVYGVEDGFFDADKVMNIAIVVGSMHDVDKIYEQVLSIVNTSNLPGKFNVCVYNSDNLASSWNTKECGCVGFWKDRAVLYGEAYYWEMVEQNGCGVPDRTLEELIQNA